MTADPALDLVNERGLARAVTNRFVERLKPIDDERVERRELRA